MKDITRLLNNNKEWAERVRKETPDFFTKLKRQQKPKYLWIGCSDSRVPANQITGLLPGDVFVHRNISNQVINTDMNLMCVLQYAVEVLKVKHIIVCGHYGCGGIAAVKQNATSGMLEHWLENVRRCRTARSGSRRRDVRAERDNAGREPVAEYHGPESLAAEEKALSARMDLFDFRRAHQGPGDHEKRKNAQAES